MTQAYTGNRKGISLVEMMIAIILFAALSTIGLKYYKNYINTDLQAMKARTAAAMEEAAQLTAAYKLFTTQYGELANLNELNATTTKIMTAIPLAITEMTTTGWEYNSTVKQFQMNLDANTTATSDEQYCVLWNKEFNASVELNVTAGQTIVAPVGATSYCSGTGTYKIYVTMP